MMYDTGFGAGCTAGILLPLHFIMGIRLAHEDELQGLDAAGRKRLLLLENRGTSDVFDCSAW